MRATSGSGGSVQTGTRFEAYETSGLRMGSGLAIAVALHLGLFVYAYLSPPPPTARKLPPIEMAIVPRQKPPTPRPPEVIPPPQPPPQVASHQEVSRPLRSLQLRPVSPQDKKSEPGSSAIVIPALPPSSPESPPSALPTGKIDLFPKSLNTIVGGLRPGEAIPQKPDPMLHDPLRDKKKEPPFVLVPEQGGGFKCATAAFDAHISSRGEISFKDSTVSFQKGSPGIGIDFGDIISRAKGIDPYAAQKRKFAEFTDELRKKLRDQARTEDRARAQEVLASQLSGIWSSGRAVTARRRDIYEQWADCSDEKADADARKSRRAIEGFIRTNLPRDSSDAYTEEELTRIASERSGLPPFEPYGAKAL